MRTALISLLVLLAPAASAHELPVSSATVSLRDGLVTVDATLDMRRWLSSAGGGELNRMLAALKKQAAREVVITLGDKRVPLKVVGFPSADQVHAALQAASKPRKGKRHYHPALLPVRLEARKALRGGAALKVTFPKALGPVVVSFVQPRTRYLKPGQAASFKVR